ncbi:MAG: 2,3-butanediol dehydrogenase [Halanaerobiales bacterium]|nr:2,3-butanediol dehydrogenase [Halanaerobiales bacterium]
MKAARWYNQKDIRVEEVNEPVITDNSVKIKVKWCGICGSDLHEYLAGPIFIPVGQPHPLSKNSAPVILGHEFSGEVVEVGKKVTKVKAGDSVIVEPIVACGKCAHCKEGKYHLCSSLGFHGLCGSGGGFAEYTTFPQEFVHKMPEGLSYEKGALVEPITVALHSLKRGNFQTGQTAVVVGAGPIGLATIECLKASGAKSVIAIELSPIRKEYAKRSGADVVLDPTEVDVISEILKLTEGIGADISFEITGVQAGFLTAINSVKSDGTIVVTSIWEKEVSIHLNSIVLSEKKIVGTLAYNKLYPSTIALMADNRIKAEGWITKKIYIDDIVNEGFESLIGSEKDKHVKILVTPDKNLL